MEELRPAATAPRVELEELANDLRRELRERGESPPSSWVSESASDLKAGRMTGWYLPPGPDGALGFYSVRGRAAFGHAHVTRGPEALERAERLVLKMRAELAPAVDSIDIGFTGLSPEQERAVSSRLTHGSGVAVLERLALSRPIVPGDATAAAPPPAGSRFEPVRAVPLEALGSLDFRAFRDTPDAALVGTEESEYRRMLGELVRGRMGRFLDEASIVLVDPETRLPRAALLTAEQDPRQAIYLDVMVDPEWRRRGVGRFLVHWGFRALWALGYESVRLWVTEANAPARALYERAGFRPVSHAVIYRWSRGSSAGQPQVG